MELDLRQIVLIARKRAWLVLLLIVIAGGTAYYRESQVTPLYSASATMLVTSGQSLSGVAGTSDYNTMLATQQLAATYPQLITNSDMQQRVAVALKLPSLSSGISASVIPDSQLIVVSVVDTDPQRAALVANTVVTEFQSYISTQAINRAQMARTGLDAQITALKKRVDEIDAQLTSLDTKANAGNPSIQRQIADLSQERATINDSLVNLNTTVVTIGAQILSASAQVESAGKAFTPEAPFSPRPRRALMLGCFIGLLLGAGVVALLEFLDNTVKPELNIQLATQHDTRDTYWSVTGQQPFEFRLELCGIDDHVGQIHFEQGIGESRHGSRERLRFQRICGAR